MEHSSTDSREDLPATPLRLPHYAYAPLLDTSGSGRARPQVTVVARNHFLFKEVAAAAAAAELGRTRSCLQYDVGRLFLSRQYLVSWLLLLLPLLLLRLPVSTNNRITLYGSSLPELLSTYM